MSDKPNCTICGEPMPEGEEMFKYHGHSGPCPKPPLPIKKTALEEVADERKRQIEEEGFAAEHDSMYMDNELADAAACYALWWSTTKKFMLRHSIPHALWPWDIKWWKPKGRRRDLIRAAALIVAEIERLDRSTNSSTD